MLFRWLSEAVSAPAGCLRAVENRYFLCAGGMGPLARALDYLGSHAPPAGDAVEWIDEAVAAYSAPPVGDPAVLVVLVAHDEIPDAELGGRRLRLAFLSSPKTRFPGLHFADLVHLVTGIDEWRRARPGGRVVFGAGEGLSKQLFVYCAYRLFENKALTLTEVMDELEAVKPPPGKQTALVGAELPVEVSASTLFASQVRLLQHWWRLVQLPTSPLAAPAASVMDLVAISMSVSEELLEGESLPTIEVWYDDETVYSSRPSHTMLKTSVMCRGALEVTESLVTGAAPHSTWRAALRRVNHPAPDLLIRVLGPDWMLRVQLHATMFPAARKLTLPVENHQIDGYDCSRRAFPHNLAVKFTLRF